MKPQDENLTESELKKKAYLIVLRLRNSELDMEAIFARLEKQGISEEIARQVIRDVIIQAKRDEVEEVKPVYQFAIIRIVIGVVFAILSMVAFPNYYILPIALIAGGIVSAFLAKKKMTEWNILGRVWNLPASIKDSTNMSI